MDQEQFKAQINRLAAAYRVEVSTGTRAAYWLAFQKTSDHRFAVACERAIEHEKTFPSIAALKEIIKYRHESDRNAAPSQLATSGSVGCLTCLDAGFIRRDVPVEHPDFGTLIPCPHCAGATKPRNHRAEYAALLARDHATRPPPPVEAPAHDRTAPPPDFARSGVPVPTTVTEEQRQRTQQRIAANVRAVAAKMDMEGAGR